MNPMPEHVGLDQAVAGMILADNLSDDEGNMLLSRGATLTEAALIILRRRKIDYLHVLSSADGAADIKTARELRRQRLAGLFRVAGSEGANGVLLRHVLQYRLEKNNE